MAESAHQCTPIRTEAEVRSEFEQHGISISAWACSRGFSTGLVYQVLSGKKRALRGQSHRIAVALGLKVGNASSLAEFDKVLPSVANTPLGLGELSGRSVS